MTRADHGAGSWHSLLTRIHRAALQLICLLFWPAGAGILAASPGQAGAAQQAAPAIRVEVKLIPVAVSVTDKSGRPVTGLRQADFKIYDNGIAMPVRYFQAEELTTAAGPAAEPPPLRNIPATEISRSGRRTFLLLLGHCGISDPFGATGALIRFVRERLLPGDLVAVMAYNRATEFTTRHGRIVAVLERYQERQARIERHFWKQGQGDALAAVYGAGVPAEIQALIGEIFTGTDLLATTLPEAAGKDKDEVSPSRRDFLAGASTSSPEEGAGPHQPGSRMDFIEADPFDRLQLRARTDLSFEEYVANTRLSGQDLQSLYAAILYLRYMEEPKHLLYLTDQGLFLPRAGPEQDLAALASDARVAIHPLQTGGLKSEFSQNLSLQSTPRYKDERGRWLGLPVVRTPVDEISALSVLTQIASRSGGRAAIHAEPDTALRRLDETTRSSYLLGYEPAGVAWDGSYHRIRVEVARSGLAVACRDGYFAHPVPVRYNSQEYLGYTRIAAAVALGRDIGDIRLQVGLNAVKDSTGEKSWQARLVIRPESLQLRETGGEYSARLFVAVFYPEAKGDRAGNTWHRLDLLLNSTEYRRAQEEGIVVTVRLPAAIARPVARAIVCDAGSGKVGSCSFGSFLKKKQ